MTKQKATKINRTTLLFVKLLEDAGLPCPELEYKFHPTRKWRLDYAWPEHGLAIEVEGGVWVRGRHNRPAGYLKDLEKYNALTLQGWRLLRYTPQQCITMEAIKQISLVLGGKNNLTG